MHGAAARARLTRATLRALACAAAALACGADDAPEPGATPTPEKAAAYVGAERCAGCHAVETAAWQASQHAQAMPAADALLGNFDGARFEETRFERRDGRALVVAEGPDGAPHEYEVAFGFGVAPLQQLLLPLPGGRLQALGVAWDARPKAQGGQRWFSLHPGERIPPDDVLHWTRPSQNWNGQCAECHATNLRKNYDAAKDAFATSWTDASVACEACHGPGSLHAADPKVATSPRFAPARASDWRLEEGADIASLAAPRPARAELDACAPCHARRSTLREGRLPGESLLDTHRPALLDEGLYEVDGQMRDEVYVYGSFLQSRMFRAGVTCGDCHDAHTAKLRAEGNALCAQCHRPERFDRADHHHHAQGSEGARCVACHMPARTYMQVDVRHDHSFRVPRPDLSAALGTPNTCTDCHRDRDAKWAEAAVARWFPGSSRRDAPHPATAIAAGRRGAPEAEGLLASLAGDTSQPAIVRATALSLLRPRSEAGAAALRAGLSDADALVRLGALEPAPLLEPSLRLAWVEPLLRDPRLAVRVQAARVLADVPAELWQGRPRDALAAALAEWRAVQLANAERPEAHVSLGSLHASFGELDEARREYETALRLAPWFVPTYVNLADLERVAGRDAESEALLRRAVALAPDFAEAHYALALALVRLGRHPDALPELERAAALAPGEPRYGEVRDILRSELAERERRAD